MNPYQFEATCQVCGERGAATINTFNAMWRGATITHKDPNIGIRNLERQAQAKRSNESCKDGSHI